MMNNHANHAMQLWVELLKDFPEESNNLQVLLGVVADKAVDLACDCQGVRTILRILEELDRNKM